ncbi:beta-galactosidase/beta-glucuronidase [Catalinimonas alkaloidigena]|uniref:glycoside hydrolase family 2 protein n=1 Tax=Catalinimonas alkaloidigena TaxID=1075417 RepID=UPI0024058F12|nr:sugar-binding domain-containing protein [Catalinimonas alkaloidigena]MDF9799395.1 beta-galactosidase/beta-glucuronidase [Catalinimonas alkaloidigena]
MKQQLITTLFIFCICTVLQAQNAEWEAVQGKIMTDWAAAVEPENPLPEYPRPQMVREDWHNLNGLWDYAVQSKGSEAPSSYEGKILVPFAIESALSGVGKRVGEAHELWYHTTFELPRSMRRKTVLLHFGAVDWEAEVFVNGQSVGIHRGGYDPFAFDISEALQGRGAQELALRVWDPTNDGPQPRGKQVKDPRGIWYTPVTGIWQTVWLEAVPDSYIQSTKNTPDLDNNAFKVSAEVANAHNGDQIRVRVMDGGNTVAERTVGASEEAVLSIDNPTLWEPGSPHLYDIEVALLHNGRVVDEVETYSAMRKISIEADENGIQRMMLNNEFVFQYGPLDQGWWPDGLYTAPTDEALKFDIEKTQDLGFNMIRKHVKVEPARWYYHCDQLGMLVWQDMPSGDMGNFWNQRPGVVMGIETERERTPESEAIFRTEWQEIMDDFHNFPSIVVWVPFNEAWGQFKTEEITNWTMEHDPSRLVNSASGGNFFPVGHIIDLHNYPDPAMPDPAFFGEDRIIVLGEFGGLGLPEEGHTWQEKDNWGYQSFKNQQELGARYKKLMNDLMPLISKGLSAAIYTQTTDVEVETNGLMTYDRKVIKFDEAQMKQLHNQLINAHD